VQKGQKSGGSLSTKTLLLVLELLLTWMLATHLGHVLGPLELGVLQHRGHKGINKGSAAGLHDLLLKMAQDAAAQDAAAVAVVATVVAVDTALWWQQGVPHRACG
jgi:hypothetical protein